MRRWLYCGDMIATVPALLPPRDRRHAGIAATILLHAVLLMCWQATRHAPSSVAPDPRRTTIQWIRLPAPAVPPRRVEEHPEPLRPHAPARAGAMTFVLPSVSAAPVPAPAAPSTAPADDLDTAKPPAPPAQSAGAALAERARRAAGAVDRALRKENYPYIVAPLDSPQIRLRNGIAAAGHAEPGMDELVNNTGDGARRTRIVAGGNTYCMTERSPATSIDTIEKHGKWRQTSCPGHESAAHGQAWRTARD
ncbi:hypothetical protein [Massilia rhizosphaerae]|uniref:hypothetical protein n=1 Tax=Massilia rhizosphaerae TaxID=2784389 RepID=UPI0018DAFBB8|nr:hypothetical protein [Massilia rhizosphaerae]